MSFALPVEAVRPRQLLVSAAKLHDVLDRLDANDPTNDPLPVLDLGGDWCLSDGHTRALALYLAGESERWVEQDPDRGELDIVLYRECVTWCEAEAVTAVHDLVGWVVSAETHEREWIEPCRHAAKRLD